jgi:hypothetical protein
MATIFDLENPAFALMQEVRPLLDGVDTAPTLTTAQLINGIFLTQPTAARNVTTPTAAAIITAMGDRAAVGLTFKFTIVNTAAGAFATTLVGGTNVTVVGGSAAVAQNVSATFIGRMASATTVIFYRA